MSDDVLNAMLEAASLAPSIHNSQPWRFSTTGDARLDIFTDESRAASVIDPHGRWLRLSCGAAAFNAALAARAAGRTCEVTVLGEPGSQVATLTLGAAKPPTLEDSALARAVPERHTMREAFGTDPVSEALVDVLRAAAEAEGAWMSVIQRPDDIVELAVLTSRGEAAEQADPAYQRELASWLRPAGSSSYDGIPTEILVSEMVPRASDVPLRTFEPSAPAVDDEGPPPVEHPLLVVIGTDADHGADWVRAGMAMQHVLLAATTVGLAASPMTQALDQPESRAQLNHLIGVVNGHPQMVLRIGFGEPAATTHRRSLESMVNVAV